MRQEAFRQIQYVGAKLLDMGINTSHSGNISIRDIDAIYISRTGSSLDRITESDIISVPLDEDVRGIASVELPVHRAIYKHSEAKAVLHAHPPLAIAFSLLEPAIYSADNEGFLFLGEVPVVAVKDVVGQETTGQILADHFNAGCHIAVVKGHGSFAVGQNLEECLHWTTTLERSCQIGKTIRDVSEFRYKEIVRERRAQFRRHGRQSH